MWALALITELGLHWKQRKTRGIWAHDKSYDGRMPCFAEKLRNLSCFWREWSELRRKAMQWYTPPSKDKLFECRCTVEVGDKIWESEQANLALNYQINMYDESPAAKIKTLCEPLNKYIISNEDQNTMRKSNTPWKLSGETPRTLNHQRKIENIRKQKHNFK